MVQKIYSNMRPAPCTNTHHDVTDLANHEMVENTKTWISWEWNIAFLWNKKVLNLCLRWHILGSYHFVVELTFKVSWICFLLSFWNDVCLFKIVNGLSTVLQKILVTFSWFKFFSLNLAFLLLELPLGFFTVSNYHNQILQTTYETEEW